MNPIQLFNPSNQSGKDIKRNFCIRKKEYARIFKVIKADKMKNAPQHYIIQGVRGSGKTTLLLRVYYEIKSDESLNNWLLPLIFNEEQYSVNKLFKFWEHIAKELESESDEYIGLLDKMQKFDKLNTYEEYCYDVLFDALKNKKNKICVLIDNIGDFLKKLSKKEQQRLREVLITNSELRIVGASSEVLESSYKYDEPFYEYFKIVQLKELKKEETKDFLLALDRISGTDSIPNIIENNPGRIEALRIITGGVPRTIVLMYEIFINDNNGDSFKNLELLLDRVTPLYKHRMDNLSSQQQDIIDCVALNWDAITVKDIARITRMESKAVSAQLGLLEKNNVILKKKTSTKNNLYQVKERFFNIWYLMRYGRKPDKDKVMWLSKFLEIWCDKDSLDDMANAHISKLKTGKIYDKYAYSLSEAYASLISSAGMQHRLLKTTKTYLESMQSELAYEVSNSDLDSIANEVSPLYNVKNNDKALTVLDIRNSNTGEISYIKGLVFQEKGNYKEAEKQLVLASKKGDIKSSVELASIYQFNLKDFKKAEEYYLLAINSGNLESLLWIALLYSYDLKEYKEAEKYFLLSIDNDNSNALFGIALLYHRSLKEYDKAEKYYLLSIEKGDAKGIASLAMLYDNEINNFIKAEKYFRMSIENGSMDSMGDLAYLYFKNGINKDKTEQLSRKAFNKKSNGRLIVCTYTLALLWNNKLDLALDTSKPLFDEQLLFNDNIEDAELLVNMLIAKGQYSFVYNIFQENKHQIKDKLKPIYYALMHFMEEKYPDEIIKMGEELNETVNEIVEYILVLREKYK